MKHFAFVLTAIFLGATQSEASTLRISAAIDTVGLDFDNLRAYDNCTLADFVSCASSPRGVGGQEYVSVGEAFHPLSNLQSGDLAVLEFSFSDGIPLNSTSYSHSVNCIAGSVCADRDAFLLLLSGVSDGSIDLSFDPATKDWSLNVSKGGGAWLGGYSFSGNQLSKGTGQATGLGDYRCCGNWAELNGNVYEWIEPTTTVTFSDVTAEGLPPVPLPASGFLLMGALVGLGSAARRRKG